METEFEQNQGERSLDTFSLTVPKAIEWCPVHRYELLPPSSPLVEAPLLFLDLPRHLISNLAFLPP